MGSVTLVVPLPVNVANARLHWKAKKRKRQAYWNQLNNLLLVRHLPKPPREAPAVAEIAVTLHVWNRMDPDNAVARLKWLLDWMTAHGYIADDNPDALRWAGMPAQTVDRTHPRVEITVRPLDTAPGAPS